MDVVCTLLDRNIYRIYILFKIGNSKNADILIGKSETNEKLVWQNQFELEIELLILMGRDNKPN